MKCRHCQRNKAVRPRGLCTSCYTDPTIKGRYPRRSFGPHGGREPTMEELDALIESRMATMPKR